MTSTTPGFVPERLTEARKARGLSATDLSSLVGISAVSISKYENGHQTPRIDALHEIAAALRMPRAYFMRPVRAADSAPIYWRGRMSAPAAFRERAAVRLSWMKDMVDFIGYYFEMPDADLPEVTDFDLASLDMDNFERAASCIRDFWDIRPGPMPDLIERVESAGVMVSRIHVGADKLDAFSQWSDRRGLPFMVLGRDKASACRQRFDVAHELSHLIVHKSLPERRVNDNAAYKFIEKQADLLASCLLLPAEEFLEELYAPSLDAFLALKERWGVSVGAMIVRSRSLDLIDDDEYRRMFINYNRRGWRNAEPLDNRIEKERPYLIRRCFELLIAEGVQTPSEILTALPFPPEDIEELADLDPGTLSGNIPRRVEPILKGGATDQSNVVSLFGGRRN